jgi:hypothetical protein
MASLAPTLSSSMKMKTSLLCVLLGLFTLGMGGKPPVAIRFYVEGNRQDTETFSSPVHLENPPRDAFIEKIPVINERMIRAIYPFQASNGTWGCSFKLDEDGRISLDTFSGSRRGSSVVAMLSTQKHTRKVIDMVIDKQISDGVITIPYGLTELEVAFLTKEFPVLGQSKNKKKKKETPSEEHPASPES